MNLLSFHCLSAARTNLPRTGNGILGAGWSSMGAAPSFPLATSSGIICGFVTLAAPWRGASSLLSLWKTNSSVLLHPLFLGLFQRSLQCPRCRSSIGSFWCWE